ncbi:MAG: HEAT repeat domain-containing protein [Acidobacteriota bacterium]
MRSTHRSAHGWALSCAAMSFGALVLIANIGCQRGAGLQGNTPDEKAIAAAKLGQNRADENVPVLQKAIETEPELVQVQAVQALGRIGTPAAVKALEAASTNESRLVRIGVAQALQDVLPETYPEAARVLVLMGERARPKSPSDDIYREERRALVTSLSVVKQPSSTDYLIERLNTDHDQNIREASTRTLGRLKDKKAVDVLIDAYGKDNERVRALAIEALGEIGDPRGLATVQAALKDFDAVTRGKAAWALMQLVGKEAIPELRACLARETNDMPAVRAAYALALLGESDAVAFLEDRLLNAASELARAESGKALAAVGRPESFKVVDRAFRDDRDGLVKREAGLAAQALLKKYPELASQIPAPTPSPKTNDGGKPGTPSKS